MRTIFVGLFLTSCVKSNISPQTMSKAPASNVYLRNSFDMDPSSYIGRFVPDGETNLDEASGMTMACSKHISHRFVEGGGVKYNEVLNVSTNVGARIGVPVLASGSGAYDATGMVRVQYELTGKMLSEIKDPVAFSECCKTNPDQCTRQYVGEFLQGKGVVYTEYKMGGNASGEGMNPSSGAQGGLTFSHGKQWQQGIEFPNPVYFAFKVNQTAYKELSKCQNWMNTVPKSAQGQYFVGTVANAKSEQKARRSAQLDAQRQAFQAGVGSMESDTPLELVPEDWCIESSYVNGKQKYTAKVLVFLSNDKRPQKQPPTSLTNDNSLETAVEDVSSGRQIPNPNKTTSAQPTQMGSFADLLAALKEESFSGEKLKLIAAASKASYTINQVSQLLLELDFENDRLKALKMLKGAIKDPQNAKSLEDLFDFDANKKQVRSILQ